MTWIWHAPATDSLSFDLSIALSKMWINPCHYLFIRLLSQSKNFELPKNHPIPDCMIAPFDLQFYKISVR
ncbi:hypothetical protein SAMN04489760_12012 [Syntrophus gentianae]|uniref:Uncharacterized protein n=1 Tax=Syntrophus gentianae TaxID=43775 RepID=A0A1H7Z5K9_9BACT|nr:hypothetical protein SAMN04489760_12012 [Syntrophus gentianae]